MEKYNISYIKWGGVTRKDKHQTNETKRSLIKPKVNYSIMKNQERSNTYKILEEDNVNELQVGIMWFFYHLLTSYFVILI